MRDCASIGSKASQRPGSYPQLDSACEQMKTREDSKFELRVVGGSTRSPLCRGFCLCFLLFLWMSWKIFFACLQAAFVDSLAVGRGAFTAWIVLLRSQIPSRVSETSMFGHLDPLGELRPSWVRRRDGLEHPLSTPFGRTSIFVRLPSL